MLALTIADEAQPPFDPRSRLIYAIIALELLLSAVAIPLLGFRVAPVVLYGMPSGAILWLGAGVYFRVRGVSVRGIDLAGLFETTGLILAQGVSALVLLIAVTAVSAPMADGALAGADRAIGFPWREALAPALNSVPALTVLAFAYKSFHWQAYAVLLLLFLRGESNRAWQMVIASAVALVITTALYPFAPADGTFIHYGIKPSDFPNLLGGSQWQFGPVIHQIKNGERLISPALFAGMVSFPSYHAAGAAIFAWAAWPLKGWRPVFLVLNALLLYGALLFGAHYFVDIIAGVVVGAISIWAARLDVYP